MSFLLEEKKIFSASRLWELQRSYFEETGFEAWRQGEVPHYVTTNPRIANSYAEIIFALYKDANASKGTTDEPYYIVELGSGSGRFAYYLFSRLMQLCDQAGVPHSVFRYVITDFTQSNADFWRKHPSLKPFFDQGLMDIAIIDVTQTNNIHLQLSGTTIGTGSLQQPLTIVANYLFDSIPQELIYYKDDTARPCFVTLTVERDPAELTTGEILEELELSYYHGVPIELYYDEGLQSIISFYSKHFNDAYAFFPTAGIQCIRHLESFAPQGMMLLTADKGDHHIDKIAFAEPPGIVNHGSFSLNVNYHALSLYCELSGGLPLFTEHSYGSINTGCLLFIDAAKEFTSVKAAYEKYIAESGPDDYFTVYDFLRSSMKSMPLKTILSVIRTSLFDSHQLEYYLPRLMELAHEMTLVNKVDIVKLVNKCWANYYPLGEQSDLASKIASLMYEIDVFDWALHYFKLSTKIYGNDTGTLYNMAACCYQMGEKETGITLIKKILQYDPSNVEAIALLKKLEEINMENS